MRNKFQHRAFTIAEIAEFAPYHYRTTRYTERNAAYLFAHTQTIESFTF